MSKVAGQGGTESSPISRASWSGCSCRTRQGGSKSSPISRASWSGCSCGTRQGESKSSPISRASCCGCPRTHDKEEAKRERPGTRCSRRRDRCGSSGHAVGSISVVKNVPGRGLDHHCRKGNPGWQTKCRGQSGHGRDQEEGLERTALRSMSGAISRRYRRTRC